MADRYAVKAGNWSDPTVWDGGTLPGVGDTVRPNGFAIEIDQDIDVGTITNTALAPAAHSGYFAITTISAGTRYISAHVACYNSQLLRIITSGVVEITGDVTGGKLYGESDGVSITGGARVTINGDVTGGSVPQGNSGTARGAAITSVDGAYLTVNGSIYGRPEGNNTHGVFTNRAAEVVVNGDIYSGTGSQYSPVGVYITAPTNIYVNGSCYGVGGGAALHHTASGAITVLGAVVATSSNGVRASHDSVIVDVRGEIRASNSHAGLLVDVASNVRVGGPLYHAANNRAPIYTPYFMVHAGAEAKWVATDDSNAPLGGAPVTLSNVLQGVPAASDVRAGTAIGAGGTIMGTMAVPPANAVRSGVPVDNTVGTAALSLPEMAAITGAQIAEAVGE